MRRCLDCGAELITGLCDNCGLTPAEAELVLRRRVLYRTAIYLLGAVAFLPAAHFYPPLELDAMLIFLGAISFVVVYSAVWIDRRARRQAAVETLKRVCYGLLPVPWLLAGLLFLNGRFDSAPPTSHATVVVGKFAMPGMLRSSRLVVLSWRPGVRIERVPIRRDDYDRFQRGDSVEVRLQNGFVGIPWVASVYHK
ncbi:MAG: hypothetical protein HY234_16025 [Acidobacteria bacterium]|nr:hypothetical protein [Acidobacteriota bacterium]MBI3664544.1 hypothetical protein [Acidobacteriota bacterium]